MKTRRHWIFSGALLLVPMMAMAQAPTENPGAQGGSARLFRDPASEKQPRSQALAMYEDIEIMRRIMNRKLGLWPNLVAMNSNCALCHVVSGNLIRNSQGQFGDIAGTDLAANFSREASSGGLGVGLTDVNQDGIVDVFLAGNHQGHDHAHASLAAATNIEGVYLKGQGVLYTLTLPPPSPSRATSAKKTSSTPATDWERFRRSVRGDQPPSKETETVKESSEDGIFAELEKSGHLAISEEILRILADNGRNFSHLLPDEKITVAITFRQPKVVTANQNQAGASNGLSAWGNQPETLNTWQADPKHQFGVSGAATGQSFETLLGGGSPRGSGAAGNASSGGLTQTPASIRDFELLGDMQLKQGKAQEAINAFQRALNLSPPARQAASLYQKISQADLMIEDVIGAQKAMEMAMENLKLASEPTKNQSTGGSAKTEGRPSLPSKLIISAPKKLMDLVANKLPYSQFRRQVTIDYFDFSLADPARPKATNKD
jgi:tetratricopeptide (TPR) repeat protein